MKVILQVETQQRIMSVEKKKGRKETQIGLIIQLQNTKNKEMFVISSYPNEDLS